MVGGFPKDCELAQANLNVHTLRFLLNCSTGHKVHGTKSYLLS